MFFKNIVEICRMIFLTNFTKKKGNQTFIQKIIGRKDDVYVKIRS